MKITAQDLLELGIIDGIINEPIGGAHRDGTEVMRAAGETIIQALEAYEGLTAAEIRKERREKFLSMGRPG
jgi:acetyl-CoA carboxylase carboxyl transferase subunit alpha